jgi:hypothetical protein
MSNPTKEQIDELKSYVTSVMNGYVVTEQMGNCRICGKYEDLRCGVCWDCAMPVCKRDHCPFRKLVYCGQGRKQIFTDFRDYIGYKESNKVRCDRESLCSDREYAIALDKEASLPSVDLDNCCDRKSRALEKERRALLHAHSICQTSAGKEKAKL